MNQILFFSGIVFAGFFLLLSIFLFFYQKVPAVIRYFLKMGNKKVTGSGTGPVVPAGKTSAKSKKDNLQRKKTSQGMKASQAGSSTELLDIAQNYATALLDADSTTLLPDLNDQNA